MPSKKEVPVAVEAALATSGVEISEEVDMITKESSSNSDFVDLRYCLNVPVYKTRGTETGQEYEVHSVSPVLRVNALDVPELLARRRVEGCCGGAQQEKSVFERA